MSKLIISVGEAMVELSGGQQDTYRLGFAGDTLNTAYYLRLALAADWQVDYFTAVGDDIYSERMVAHIAASGVGTELITRIAGKRAGLYMIHQADGDRHFTYWRDTSAAKLLADDKDRLDAALGNAQVIYFSGITLAILAPEARERLIAAIGARRRAGAMVAFDPNIRPALWSNDDAVRDALTAAARVASLVLPTHADEVRYFGDTDASATADRYLAGGADEVVVKNGGDPALVVTRERRVSVPADSVDSVVDATGAGDSFNGGYIAARLCGADPEAAARQGHATAGVVIGHHGALVPRDAFALNAQSLGG
ncbi:sugar kinase [Pelagibacterium xiamenense]|uniref:sugar kinase n=1 Tax=Pelagibacterium xiamenense TaxID=2901140 RepID=UPI001E2BA8CF|nr:sugar kinase [Pelagibacterium xiamenense]MCD7058981.1 sugar kinase [Pelagibacterium xiamenense]